MFEFLKRRSFIGDFLALLAGCLVPLAFAPLGYYLFAVIGPAILLYSLLTASTKRSFWRGWLFGIGMYGVGVSWVYVSIHVFGQTPAPIAALLTILFICVLAVYSGLTGYVFNKLFVRNTLLKIVIGFPAVWVLFEWLRSWLLSGFPWLLIGYSQVNSGLSGLAPIFGVFGVTFMVILCSALLFILFTKQTETGYRFAGKIRGWDYLVIATLLYIWFGAAMFSWAEFTKPTGKPVTVSLVQGNIPQLMKWNPSFASKTITIYTELTQKNWDSDVIVWPEAAIPYLYRNATAFLSALSREAKKHNTAIITGIPMKNADKNEFFNAVITVGTGSGQYRKRHLVPFGEFLPLHSLLKGLINFFALPMSDFVPGPKRQANLLTKHLNIAPFICYEIAYPDVVLSELPEANVLLTITNDAWFGDSLAPAQHLEIAQMRSLQTGRYQMIASNNGITAIIKPNGEIQKQLPQFKTAVLTDKIYAMQGITPWLLIGNWPIIILMLLLICWCWYKTKK